MNGKAYGVIELVPIGWCVVLKISDWLLWCLALGIAARFTVPLANKKRQKNAKLFHF
jgi:hypothetical protein